MDGYSGKRAANGVVFPRKGSSLILKDDSVNQKDRNAKCCSRIGCSSRLNPMKGTQICVSEKAKSSTPSFRSSSSGKEIIGSSSRACSSVSNTKKTSAYSQKKLIPQVETDSSETSSVLDEPEVSELITPPGKISKVLNVDSKDASQGDAELLGGGSSTVPLNARSRRSFSHRSALGNQDSLPGSSHTLATRSTSQTNRVNAGRYGLRNLRCNLVSDVVQSSSSSDSNVTRRKDIFKKRISDGEGSSSGRGKKMSGSLAEGRASSSSHGVSISDSGRPRTWTANRDATAAVRTRRLVSGYGRTRLSSQGNGNTCALNESNDVIPQVGRPEMPTDMNALSSAELTTARVLSLPGNNAEGMLSVVPTSPSDVGTSRMSITREGFREGFRRYNMDGIAEVLLALERMEQDELTYEQLLILETSLLLNGLSFHDQHRDMRLDIDNMTYEELLALEERMGTVSTALSEEALSKCLKTSTFELASERKAVVNQGDKDDIKCSICQEEYDGGDEVGSLRCEHRFHIGCIQQWMRVKNWCPICKASAEHTPIPSSS